MLKYIGRRILMMIPILLAVTFVVFTLLYITPGNPAELMLGQNATPEAVAELEEELGLNRPFLVRYADYLMGLLRLDMGTSYATKEAVMTRIWNCVPYTLELAAISIFIAAVIGTPIGIISATKQYTAFDNVTMIFAGFLDRHPADPAVLRAPEMATSLGMGDNEANDFACYHGGSAVCCRYLPYDPLLHAGGDPEGLHPHCPGKGPEGI